MGAEQDLFCKMPAPGALPACAASLAAVLMHGPDRIGKGRERAAEHLPAVAQVKGVLHLARRMVLRHEQRLRVPECGLRQRAAHLLEAHLQPYLPDVCRRLPDKMPPATADGRDRAADIVCAERLLPPGAGSDKLRGERLHAPPSLDPRLEGSLAELGQGSGPERGGLHHQDALPLLELLVGVAILIAQGCGIPRKWLGKKSGFQAAALEHLFSGSGD